jgi:hypothetical protein
VLVHTRVGGPDWSAQQAQTNTFSKSTTINNRHNAPPEVCWNSISVSSQSAMGKDDFSA